ncbi:MAG: hypothetical protein ACOC1F_04000 [Myxococcota bacterium]
MNGQAYSACRWSILVVMIVGALAIGCGHTGFVGLSEPAPPASPAKPLPIYASRDIGQPYRVLGYVFRTTEGHKSGLQPMDEHMHVLTYASEEMTELRRQALARGADAIVGFEMFPTLNGWGQPVGFSVGGLAVKFEGGPPSPDRATPDVDSKTAPLEEPEPAPAEEPGASDPPELPAP